MTHAEELELAQHAKRFTIDWFNRSEGNRTDDDLEAFLKHEFTRLYRAGRNYENERIQRKLKALLE